MRGRVRVPVRLMVLRESASGGEGDGDGGCEEGKEWRVIAIVHYRIVVACDESGRSVSVIWDAEA